MKAYSIMLFLHVLGAVALFAGFGVEWLSLHYLRSSVTREQVQVWAKLAASGLPLNLFASLAILIPGGYLATKMNAWGQGWIGIGLLAMLLMGALGGAVIGRQRRVLRRISSQTTDKDSTIQLRQVFIPLLKASLHIRMTLAVGAIFLMVSEPGLEVSLFIMGIALACGFVWMFASLERPAVLGRQPEEGRL